MTRDLRILVVEDDRQVLPIITDRLQRAGYTAVAVETGAAGLEAYRADRPDATIIDIMLPDMDGRALIGNLLKEDPDARIVAISGAVDLEESEFPERARQVAMLRILPKPFSTEDLLTAIEAVLAPPPMP